MKRIAWFVICSAVFVIGCSSSNDTSSTPPASPPTDKPADVVSFSTVQPVFAKCLGCHSGASAKEGIDFTNHASIMRGGEHGPVVMAGDPDSSDVVKALKGQGKKQMPPNGKLPDEEIQKVVDWIKAGAKE